MKWAQLPAFKMVQPNRCSGSKMREVRLMTGLVAVWRMKRGDVGGSVHAEGGNGLAPGLSQRTITELAEDYTEAAYRLNKEGSDIDSRALDADLRRRLAEMVLPEVVETEFERVMLEVFRV